MVKLTPDVYREGIQILASQQPVFAAILMAHGPPPLWDRPAGFPTLIKIILEQQVSLSSAAAAFSKLQNRLKPLTPAAFLTLSDPELKEIGFSRQKTAYGRNVSRAVLEGSLNLPVLEKLDDEQVRKELIKIKGIGRWTADIYLLMVLLRADVWPMGDLALAKAVMHALELESLPDYDQLSELALSWKPWRAVAARYFWHYYLSNKLQRI